MDAESPWHRKSTRRNCAWKLNEDFIDDLEQKPPLIIANAAYFSKLVHLERKVPARWETLVQVFLQK